MRGEFEGSPLSTPSFSYFEAEQRESDAQPTTVRSLSAYDDRPRRHVADALLALRGRDRDDADDVEKRQAIDDAQDRANEGLAIGQRTIDGDDLDPDDLLAKRLAGQRLECGVVADSEQ
ncbi:MAG TPA: hypothetical protein VI759_06535 [Dehalococcoidia bacterium]|nr:hypothetical protein [Dehalococcoidia bacterium]